MLKRIIKAVIPVTIIIGALLIALNISSIEGITVIEQNSISYGTYTWTYYTFNLKTYLQNIENSLTDVNALGIIVKQPQVTIPTPTDVLGWLRFIGNILLVYITNWLIYALNWLLLTPLKMILYPINILLAILGINTTNNEYIQIIQTLYNFQLPYIPYF